MTFTDDLAVIATIIACISLGLQFYKSWKERPQLSFKFENLYYFPPDKRQSSIWYEIHIFMLIDNLGNRNTTIHSANLSFDYKGKPYSLSCNLIFDNIIKADSTLRPRISFTIKETEINLDSDIVDAKLEIHYTHKTKTINIPKIEKLPNYPPS